MATKRTQRRWAANYANQTAQQGMAQMRNVPPPSTSATPSFSMSQNAPRVENRLSPRSAQAAAASKPAMSFNQAFAAARKQGLKQFEWRGKQYGTQLASEVQKPKSQGSNVQPVQEAQPSPAAAPASSEVSKNGPYRPVPTRYTGGSERVGPFLYPLNVNLTSAPAHNPDYENIVPPVQSNIGVPHNWKNNSRTGATQPVAQESPKQKATIQGTNIQPVQARQLESSQESDIGPYRPAMVYRGATGGSKDRGPFLMGSATVTTSPATRQTNSTYENNNPDVYNLGQPANWGQRFKKGGKLGNKQEEFVAYLIQLSGAQDEKDLDEYIQDLGQEGLKQEFEKFEELMIQGTEQVPAAAKGAKLNYIKSLRGKCPEGFEMQYFKKGGVMCSQCIKKAEAQKAPKKAEKGTKVVQNFKNDLAKEKCGGKVKMKTKKKEQGGTMPDKKDMTKTNKLTSKNKVQIKKHFFGGKL